MSTPTQNKPKTAFIKRFMTFIVNFPPYLYFPVKQKAQEKTNSDGVK
ncbi:hypothetical protein L4D06_23950 [Enterovibrio makurazakiensis]|uniref:Uncharacterized protein n=1 Tax=Enterovibrio gelatinilyticus TaxID=2899819 RepID=A0ABT5R4F9_9GAMM|nr:hypothetical protein [Enterovibrio sp. ZSDZ42]MDD1795060.1 hypothetical protein [Enterovibrio sp. ZSDZ42]